MTILTNLITSPKPQHDILADVLEKAWADNEAKAKDVILARDALTDIQVLVSRFPDSPCRTIQRQIAGMIEKGMGG